MRLLARYAEWAEKHEIGWMLVTYGLAPLLGSLAFLLIKRLI